MQAASQPAPDPKSKLASAKEALPGRSAPLDAMFNPKTVAVIGASERPDSVGCKTLSALISNDFGGKVFAVNPGRASVLGVKAYARVSEIPEPVDLAVVVTAAEKVPEIIGECVQAAIKGAVVVSAGLSEAQAQQIRDHLRGSRMRVIGPDCLGILNPVTGLNTSFALRMPLGGNIAFLSQSGAVCTFVLDWSFKEIVGFSAFVSVGAMLDVDWGDLIDYFGRDVNTRSIIIYMESIGSVRSLLSAAREVSLSKPIIVVKAARTPAAARVVNRLSGCDSGDDEVLDAAFRRVGVLRVEQITDLFSVADALSKQPRPNGQRLVVVSNTASPSVLAADAVAMTGGELAELSRETCQELKKCMPPQAGEDNPIVALGASPETYVKAVEIAAKEPNCDGILAVMVPQAMAKPDKAAELMLGLRNLGKPLLACFMGALKTAAGPATLTRACIPTFAFPHAAARAFGYMWRYSYDLRGIYETPALAGDLTDESLRAMVRGIIHEARDSGQSELTAADARQLLAAYRIPCVETRIARSEGAAARIAGEIGFPVSLQLVVDSVTEKLPITGTRLTLLNAEAVCDAWKVIAAAVSEKAGGHALSVALEPLVNTEGYELSIASRMDAQFGPVLLFGVGGRYADPASDRALGLPPANATLALRMMEQTRIFKMVRAANPKAVAELTGVLVRLSQLVVEQPWIREIEINPLVVTPQRLLALGARIAVHGPEVREQDLPRPAIRPYPTQYVSTWTMKDGQPVTFRPIRAEDEPLMVKFHEKLSDESVYLRYFQQVKLSQRTQHERLTRICFIDYDREMALVAERRDPHTDERRIIALGSLNKLHGTNDGEFAVMISDDFQGRGLGSAMVRQLVRVARDEKLSRVVATTMTENRSMTAIMKHLGFKVSVDYDEQLVKAEMAV